MVTSVTKRFILALSAVVMAFTLGMACASSASAEEVLESPFEVVDEATQLQVSKLDKANHSFVEGAKLQIAESASGKVIDTWTTGKGLYSITEVLDADKEYVLTEIEAPDGYAVAEPVTFKIASEEGAGVVIVSGADAEPVGDFGLNLYDSKLETEKVVHKPGKKTVEETKSGKGPQTGDTNIIWPVVAIAVLALVVIAVALRMRHSKKGPKHARE